MTDHETITRDLKHEFTPDELRELGAALARANKAVEELEDTKKNENARITGVLREASLRVSQYAWKINCGYEMRSTECIVLLDTPLPGLKRLLRVDNGDTVTDEPMTDQEKQGRLIFGGDE
jgi:translation initiation factor IF-1